MTTRRKSPGAGLPVINPRAAAIDVGSRFHVVAVAPELSDQPVQTFQAFTDDLQRMARWLKELGIATVAMESTGVYWVAVYEVLQECGIEVVVANARDARSVPGCKSDVNDAQWLQRLHACGLLRGSFRPERNIAELRAFAPRPRNSFSTPSALLPITMASVCNERIFGKASGPEILPAPNLMPGAA